MTWALQEEIFDQKSPENLIKRKHTENGSSNVHFVSKQKKSWLDKEFAEIFLASS